MDVTLFGFIIVLESKYWLGAKHRNLVSFRGVFLLDVERGRDGPSLCIKARLYYSCGRVV